MSLSGICSVKCLHFYSRVVRNTQQMKTVIQFDLVVWDAENNNNENNARMGNVKQVEDGAKSCIKAHVSSLSQSEYEGL